MIITFEIKKDQLDEIIYALQTEKIGVDNITIVDRVYYYLYTDVMKKLLKKQIDKADDYSNKPFKVKLKYPEAAALYSELIKVDNSSLYRYNCVRLLYMNLRQKLQ